MTQLEYIGEELDLFAEATNWKSYWKKTISPHVVGDCIEVGAGNGNNMPLIHSLQPDSLCCLEPDPDLFNELKNNAPEDVETINGILSDLPEGRNFDSILYIDVLEHIEDDRAEFKLAASKLKSGGKLIILCPAHQFLYSPFDEAIGHFRRYNKRMFRELGDGVLSPRKLKHLDAVGFFASVANKLALRKSQPTKKQIKLWDSYMVPVSKIIDPLILHGFGKSIVGVWTKT